MEDWVESLVAEVEVSGLKLRPMVLLCHSARSAASRRVMGKRGEVEREEDEVLVPGWELLVPPPRVDSPLSLGIRCILQTCRTVHDC